MLISRKVAPTSRLVIVLSALLFLTACSTSTPVKTPPALNVAMTKAAQDQVTPDIAIQLLKDGNQRFITGTTLKRDLLAQQKASGVNGQFPIASIVSCIDSRSDPAIVFDQGVGDIFINRVAGNIVNEDILGSLEYASKVVGARAIVVLGHTHCGAVKGACDNAVLGNLTQLVAKIAPAVKATPDTEGTDRSSKNHHFVDAVAEMNVKMTVDAITQKSPVLKEMVSKGQIKIIGAMLDVETGKIEFY